MYKKFVMSSPFMVGVWDNLSEGRPGSAEQHGSQDGLLVSDWRGERREQVPGVWHLVNKPVSCSQEIGTS